MAEVLHDACKNVGFLYLTNHGVDLDLVEKVKTLAREFFALPEKGTQYLLSQTANFADKESISIANNDFARGYQRLGQNITKYAKVLTLSIYAIDTEVTQDWHEAIDLYAEIDETHTIKKRGLKCLSGKNRWPQIPGFKETSEHYVEEMNKVGLATMRAMAMSLGLNENYFDATMEDGFWCMRYCFLAIYLI